QLFLSLFEEQFGEYGLTGGGSGTERAKAVVDRLPDARGDQSAGGARPVEGDYPFWRGETRPHASQFPEPLFRVADAVHQPDHRPFRAGRAAVDNEPALEMREHYDED